MTFSRLCGVVVVAVFTVQTTYAAPPSSPSSPSSPAQAVAPAPLTLSREEMVGVDKVLAGMPALPKDSPFTKDISGEPVDPNSGEYIKLIGANRSLHPDFGTRYGIPFNVVDKSTPRYSPKFQYADESDAGPYPIPEGVLIEGPSDCHILCVDKDSWMLYEMWASKKVPGGWAAGSGAIFDLKKNPSRPKGWTSADAAGLPIFPLLVRYDEVHVKKEIPHAIRFTIDSTMRGYVAPATHMAPHHAQKGSPPMGIRVRLKGSVDISGYPPDAQVILTCLKKYGMILADNGSNWFISGAPDPRWDDEVLNTLKKIKGQDFEVVKMGPITTR